MVSLLNTLVDEALVLSLDEIGLSLLQAKFIF